MYIYENINIKSAYRSPEHACRGSEVERTTFRVGVHPLSDELSIFHLIPLHCKIIKIKSNSEMLISIKKSFLKSFHLISIPNLFAYMILK